jgi:hypothetical protein
VHRVPRRVLVRTERRRAPNRSCGPHFSELAFRSVESLVEGVSSASRRKIGRMRSVDIATACFVGAISLAGCGANGNHGTSQTGAGGNLADGSAGATASGGSGSGGAAGTSGAGDGGPTGTAGGGVRPDAGSFDPFADGPTLTVASMVYSLGGPPLMIMQDLPAANASSGPTCTPIRYGDCIVDNCTGVDPNQARLSAGVITVDSPAAGVHIGAAPNTASDYLSMPGDKAFGGGEAFTVSANGGDIPAFSVNMQAPLLLLVDQPTKPTLAPTSVAVAAPHAEPLTLSWTRGVPGVFLVVQSLAIQGFGAFGTVNARCFFDSQAGTGTVPAAVLSDVMVGQQFVLLTATAAVIEAGAQTLTVWFIGEALTPDKKANVMLEVQ